jgi:class 3 adenylate cyclase
VVRAAFSGGISTLSADDAAARLRAGLEAVNAAVAAEGGVACAVAGAGVVAMFGAAEAGDPPPERALRAVRAMRDAAAAHALELRAGIDHGRVLLVDAAAGREPCVAGDAADRAERLLAAAKPGEILAGPGAAPAAGLERSWPREVFGERIEVYRG